MLRGVRHKLRREHNDRAWLAWHMAYLNAYAPNKSHKFPKLDKLLWKPPPKPQSIDEMRNNARKWIESLHKQSNRRNRAIPDEKNEAE